jgi:ATP-dependent Lhr-like helicase
MLRRINGRITHMPLSQISPLAIPIMLDIGKESVRGSAEEEILRELADSIDAHRRLP